MFTVLKYLWAFPGTFLGLCLLIPAWLTGGSARLQHGILEVHGGAVKWLLRRGLPFFGPAAALTLGHVVLGRDQSCLDRSRAHELVHVRQYERWGPLFIPAYLLASLWCKLRGYDPYLDNPFEVEAYRASD